MIKRAIWIVVIILICGYFINNYLESRAKENSEKVEEERIKQATIEAVAQLVKKTNAVDNWKKDLSKGHKFRLEPILTVELERLWLTDRPILFVGAIKDIATNDQATYRIDVESSSRSSDYRFATELQLALQCSKQKSDSFLKKHPDLFEGHGFKNDVAVIADIDEIETKTVSGSDGEREEIKVGKGQCIDMVYTGRVRF